MGERIALLDSETTGTEPGKDRAIEVAVCVFDVQLATPRAWFSSLIRAEANPAEAVNRIPACALETAPEPEAVWRRLRAVIDDASCIVAHNAEFDRQFVPITDRPWVCTMEDFVWPDATRTVSSLAYLALEHGVPLISAHRALADVDIMARLLMRLHERGTSLPQLVGQALERAQEPKATFVSNAPYEDRERVKAAGFRWHPEVKEWRRRMRLSEVDALSFRVSIVEEVAA